MLSCFVFYLASILTVPILIARRNSYNFLQDMLVSHSCYRRLEECPLALFDFLTLCSPSRRAHNVSSIEHGHLHTQVLFVCHTSLAEAEYTSTCHSHIFFIKKVCLLFIQCRLRPKTLEYVWGKYFTFACSSHIAFQEMCYAWHTTPHIVDSMLTTRVSSFHLKPFPLKLTSLLVVTIHRRERMKIT